MERWDRYYNYRRPHSAIKYLAPADYYRGNPDDRIAERKEKLVQAVEMRKAYWQKKDTRNQGQTLTQLKGRFVSLPNRQHTKILSWCSTPDSQIANLESWATTGSRSKVTKSR